MALNKNEPASSGLDYGKIVVLGSLATAAGAVGSEFLTEQWVEIVTRIGLPIVLLAVVVRYAVHIVDVKDAEIKRLNESRVRDAIKHAERLYKVATSANEMVRESNETLDAIAERNQP